MSITKELQSLQIAQRKHDEVYHSDVLAMGLHDRLKHFALHFAKYTGKLTCNDAKRAEIMTDSLLIALASANALNIRLAERFALNEWTATSLCGLGQGYMRGLFSTTYREYSTLKPNMLKFAAAASGKIAAACEKLDHLESYPFREMFIEGVAQYVALAVAYLAELGIDPMEAIILRHIEIEQSYKGIKANEVVK